MALFIILFISIVLLSLFAGINKTLRIYIILFLFLVLPIASVFITPLLMLQINITPARLFIIPLLFFMIPGLLKNDNPFRISSFSLLLVVFLLFMTIIEWINGKIFQSQLFDFILFFLFSLLIDNISFDLKDLKLLSIVLSILAIVALSVSLVQFFIDPEFMMNKSLFKDYEKPLIKAFENKFRCQSIFTGLLDGDGDFIIGIVVTFLLFRYAETKKLIFWLTTFVMSMVAFFTFNRSTWIFVLIALLFYSFFKVRRIYFILILTFIILNIVADTFIISAITRSSIYQERILSSSYEERITTLQIFFDHLLKENILLGSGDIEGAAFKSYGRWGGSLNGFISIYTFGGIIGLFLYCMLLYSLFKRFVLIFKSKKNFIGFAVLSGFILYNFTLSVPEFYEFIAFYLLLIISKIYLDINRKAITVPQRSQSQEIPDPSLPSL